MIKLDEESSVVPGVAMKHTERRAVHFLARLWAWRVISDHARGARGTKSFTEQDVVNFSVSILHMYGRIENPLAPRIVESGLSLYWTPKPGRRPAGISLPVYRLVKNAQSVLGAERNQP